MAKYGVTFAAIGLAFSGIDCAAETFRGDSQHPLKTYHAELPAASNLACSPCLGLLTLSCPQAKSRFMQPVRLLHIVLLQGRKTSGMVYMEVLQLGLCWAYELASFLWQWEQQLLWQRHQPL